MKARVWCFVFGVLLCGQVAWGADRVKLDLVGGCTIAGDFNGIVLQEDHAYLLATNRLQVIDIADPQHPTPTGSVEAPIGSQWRKVLCCESRSTDFALIHDVAYVFDDNGLQLIDVHDPANPMLGTHIKEYGSGQIVAIGSQVIWFQYSIGGSWPWEYRIIDITNPEEPQVLLGLFENLGEIDSIVPDFPRLYLGGGRWVENDTEGSGVRIYDISDLSNPVFLGQTTDVPYAEEILPNGGYLYCCGGYGIWPVYFILDVRDASQPIRVSGDPFNGNNPLFGGQEVTANLRANGNMLWASWRYQTAGPVLVSLSDISEPSRPSRLGEFSLECGAFTIRDGMLYACGLGSGLRIYRITELPAITHQFIQNGKLNLQWNEPARGMKLQRSTSLESPVWEDMQGSEGMLSVELPLWGGQEYFRLAFEGPENMVWIPPGTFMMGSPEDEVDRMDNEGPQTQVTLTRGFWMGKYEVTQGEYLKVMGNNPSYFNGVRQVWDPESETEIDVDLTDLNRPVESVSWNDATAYCAALTERELAAGRIPMSYAYRLPTEAEWEYACRAGTTTRFSYGDDPGYTNLADYAWPMILADRPTHPVGQKLPNPWGLYDMHGNVWEWCLDWYAENLPGELVLDLEGPATGEGHVIRSGYHIGWLALPRYCRSANRWTWVGDSAFSSIGIRAVLAPGQ